MRFSCLIIALVASVALSGGVIAQTTTKGKQTKGKQTKGKQTKGKQTKGKQTKGKTDTVKKAKDTESKDTKSKDTKSKDKTDTVKKAKDKTDTVKKAKDTKTDKSKKSTAPRKFKFSKLKPAKPVEGLCLIKYRISTSSPKCQQFFDQGLGWFYSYAYMESVRSFETAIRHDPKCAMAWWGLSRAMAKYRLTRRTHTLALKKAQELMPKASAREQMLIKARVQEYGLLPEQKDKKREEKYKAAITTLNDMLAIYPEDEEAWFYRGYLEIRAGNGTSSGVPFYKALLKVNPLHAGANHELVHFYERFRRPALGWTHALRYMKSSPKIPHAWHMQAHLAMRLGRWKETTNWSARAVELQEAHHKYQGISPRSDSQFSHHLEILMISLTHDGRFQEAEELHKKCKKYGFRHTIPWFRLHMAKREYEEAMGLANASYKKDRTTRSYLRALVYFARGETDLALRETETVEAAHKKRKKDQRLEKRYWLVDGISKCRKGSVDEGLKQLKKLVDWSKDDYRAHSWGGGAYYMLIWGKEALRAGRFDVAEEAFLEAIAHDPGNVYGCLGMQVICEVQNRKFEAQRFSEIARTSWSNASSTSLLTEQAAMRDLVPMTTTQKSKTETAEQK